MTNFSKLMYSINRNILVAIVLFTTSHYAGAIILIPLPNLAFPDVISKTRDLLEKSNETKAMATVGEDKLFGSRAWAWGRASGKMTQAEADTQALRDCESQLRNLKGQVISGQPLYNFGNKGCELYKFQNVTVSFPDAVPTPPTPTTPVVTAPVVKQDGPSTASSTVSATQIPSTTTTIKSGTATMQKLQDLESLLKQGLIDQDDYNRKKKQFLDEM